MQGENKESFESMTEEQLSAFECELMDDNRWDILRKCIDSQFPNGEFQFLDIGGGNGIFADRVLKHYPKSTGTLIDGSKLLIGKNTKHARKSVIYGNIENISNFITSKYDIVFANWVFHHLVTKGTYSKSLYGIKKTLMQLRGVIKDTGVLSVFEIMYNGYYYHNMPGLLIHHFTQNRYISWVAKYFGANTAGTGVTFQSQKGWTGLFKTSGYLITGYTDDIPWEYPLYWNLLMHVKSANNGHFWLEKE